MAQEGMDLDVAVGPGVPVPDMANMAKLSVTHQGEHGDLGDPVPYDMDDAALRRIAEEALRNGSIPGVRADAGASLDGYVIERFRPNEAYPFPRVMLRPKTAVGGR